ncbi:TIGR03032 family protein [Rhodobacteraceae bacterium NNCM2]|nr:TIGR03032 family protein [Coraliihabitans acroporae]
MRSGIVLTPFSRALAEGGDVSESETTTPAQRLELRSSRLFAPWLADTGASLAFTTYQAGKLFLIGTQPDGKLSVFERTFARSMGLGVTRGKPGTFHMSSLFQLWRFENFLDPGEVHNGYDAVFVPVNGHTTGDIDIHDIHAEPEAAPLFVATRFNCLARLVEDRSFQPVWKPPFIDRIAAEDRCHLNGMAMGEAGDLPAYVTCVSRSNVADGWRENRLGGGVVLDVRSGEVVCEGLSMPHSPRLHGGKLWLLQSGTGEFGTVDLKSGKFEPLCFLQGFARGVAFLGDHAVIGLSRPRSEASFSGLPVNERLSNEGVPPRCGLAVVNLRTGDVEHSLDLDGVVEELYDVAVLPGYRRPMALGFKSSEIRFMVRPGAL